MPFGGQFDGIYRTILKPAIEAAGYEPVRGDDVHRLGAVIDDVFHQIRSAAVLVADVSGRNANVNYELGAAHVLGKPVVIIGQEIDDVPFDFAHQRIFPYNTQSQGWADELANKVTNALKDQRQEAERKSSERGRKAALVGKWVGTLKQQAKDSFVEIETEMEMTLQPGGHVRGQWVLLTEQLNRDRIVFNVSCTTIHEQYIKLDFDSADETLMTFGTFMARLSADSRTIDGHYVGYGSISDKLVTGSVTFSKVQDKQPARDASAE